MVYDESFNDAVADHPALPTESDRRGKQEESKAGKVRALIARMGSQRAGGPSIGDEAAMPVTFFSGGGDNIRRRPRFTRVAEPNVFLRGPSVSRPGWPKSAVAPVSR